ncbi:MAG: SIMPL domain-containing protein [Pseudomonadota bacterium]
MQALKAVIAAGVMALWAAPLMAQQDRLISVVGEGQVAAAPDLATVTLGVTQEAKLAAEALRAVSSATRDVFDGLEAMSIESRDIQTSRLSLNPQWSTRKQNGREFNVISGYTASNMVTVIVRDLENLGVVLDAVVQSGANNFNGLSFGFAEPQALEDAARIAAVGDARRKAEMLAQAAGVTLGDVQSISETAGRNRPVPLADARMAMESAVPIAEGELSLTSRVSVVFSIAE